MTTFLFLHLLPYCWYYHIACLLFFLVFVIKIVYEFDSKKKNKINKIRQHLFFAWNFYIQYISISTESFDYKIKSTDRKSLNAIMNVFFATVQTHNCKHHEIFVCIKSTDFIYCIDSKCRNRMKMCSTARAHFNLLCAMLFVHSRLKGMSRLNTLVIAPYGCCQLQRILRRQFFFRVFLWIWTWRCLF